MTHIQHSNKKTNSEVEMIDFYLPLPFREFIEKNYYEKINRNMVLENVIHDPWFLENPLEHVALYTDHGVMHVRDITRQVLDIIPSINGVLFPERENKRLEFMKGYACILAYLHDIGMVNPTEEGRLTHAEFIAHEVFKPEFDSIIDYIWDNNIGGMSWTLTQLQKTENLTLDPKVLLREIMSMAYCHSKSAAPGQLINDNKALQKRMRTCLSHTLKEIYFKKKKNRLEKSALQSAVASEELKSIKLLARASCDKDRIHHHQSALLSRHYTDFMKDSYHWLLPVSDFGHEFVHDVVDVVRIIRTADALRQRGTVLKTSGNYQIFIDRGTGTAVYALKSATGKMYLVSVDKPINAAEANLASTDITIEGNLAFSFYCGNFFTREATTKVINSLVTLIDDIQLDVIESFARPPELAALVPDYVKKNAPIHIMLETIDDNPRFTHQLANALIKYNPSLAPLIKIVPSLRNVPAEERERYLLGEKITWSTAKKRIFLNEIGRSGHITHSISLQKAFNFVRIITVQAGDMLMRDGDYAGFVYIALGTGLKGMPGGGYDLFDVNPYTLLGSTGVIRGDIRNASVIAGDTVDVVVIPKEIYLKYWHRTYSGDEFIELIKNNGIE